MKSLLYIPKFNHSSVVINEFRGTGNLISLFCTRFVATKQSFLFPKKEKKGGIRKHSGQKEAAKRAQRETIQLGFEEKLFLWGRKKEKRFTREEKINDGPSLGRRRQRLGFHLSERIIRGRVKAATPREIHGDGAGAIWEIYLTRLDEDVRFVDNLTASGEMDEAWRLLTRRKKKKTAWRTRKWRPRRSLTRGKLLAYCEKKYRGVCLVQRSLAGNVFKFLCFKSPIVVD